MAGIPTESPLVLRESLGSSHNRLTSAEDCEEALLSDYPPVGLLDAKNIYHAEQKGHRLPRPERRGLRSPWGQCSALVLAKSVSLSNILHLRRLHDDVRNVPLSKHGIEGRDILGQELLEFLRVLLALPIQLILHRQLLRGGRKIR